MGKPGQRKQHPEINQARQRIWNSMRQLRTFTTGDLVATAEATYANAKKLVRNLLDAGYLVVAVPRQSGKAMGHAQYRLIRNTGPVAPRFSKDGLYDANLADPYDQRPNKRINRHAFAILKSLRELVDLLERDAAGDVCNSDELATKVAHAKDVLRRHDEDRA